MFRNVLQGITLLHAAASYAAVMLLLLFLRGVVSACFMHVSMINQQ